MKKDKKKRLTSCDPPHQIQRACNMLEGALGWDTEGLRGRRHSQGVMRNGKTHIPDCSQAYDGQACTRKERPASASRSNKERTSTRISRPGVGKGGQTEAFQGKAGRLASTKKEKKKRLTSCDPPHQIWRERVTS
jgi:hypothetical protein